jgi:hypothetical protein
MKTTTMEDLMNPKNAKRNKEFLDWLEHQAWKGVSPNDLPIDNEVRKWFIGYLKDKEEEAEERLRGW